MKIIGYYCNNQGLLVNSLGNFTDKPPYLDFILKDKTNTNIIQVFYNINYNVANILKAIHITKEQGKTLNETEDLSIPPYKLKYVQGKFFSIKKGGFFASISDISQYCNTKLEDDETKDICEARAIEAAKIGTQIIEGLNSLGLYPTTITSPVRAFEKEKLEKLNLPTLDDMPQEVTELADECCDASWLEGYRIGHWDNVFDYDIISAYPYQTSKLVDIRYGHWEETDKFDTHAIYGYFLCKVQIYPTSKISPIMYVLKNSNNDYNRNFTPTGTWYRVLTKKQIEFIYYWNLGKVEIIYGIVYLSNADRYIYPLKDTMEWLYIEKENNIKAGNGQRKESIKRIMSGIYGKFREVRNSRNPETGKYEKIYGPFANLVYAAEIETNTKLEVADFILRNKLSPIHIAVDGNTSKENVKADALRNEFGGWRLNNWNSCISISTGVIAIKGKFDENPEEKKDFSLEYDWLLEQIRTNPDSRIYVMKKKSPISLAIATKDDGKRWDELGQLQNITRSINVGYEEKRIYKEMPKSGKEVLSCDLESYPLNVTVLNSIKE